MNKPLTVWFDDAGNLLLRADKWRINQAKSETAQDFTDLLVYDSIWDGGNSAGRVMLVATSGRKYSMFLDDFDKVIKANKFINNQIEGTFRFVKRGQAQAIKLLLPLVPPAP